MNFAEQLKGQLDIVEVIQQYVRLKRSGSGQRYIGLCPFHSEKTPSFNVNGANQFYKCFGCDAGGDVFKFVQEMESLTFPEALKVLADRNGIPIPQRQRADDSESQHKTVLLEMHEMAAGVFQDNLRGSAGVEARQYLESRGVSRSAVDEFRLGLSDGSGQQLVGRLQRFGPELMEQSGLVRKRQDGSGFFDAFRARLMFPIHSEQGQVVAFGGRALRSGDEPKYLNSPETKVYKKSTVLYNLHRAKIDARKHDRMVLVEGYMDAIGVYSAGVHEVVAVCGTSLSSDQVRSIKRQTSQLHANTGQVILNFDPDPAGSKSAEKYIGTFLAEGVRVKVLELPGGLDPDEYVQKEGRDSYVRQLNTAGSYFHWLAARARMKFGMQTVEGRVDAFRSLLPALQQVSDKLERSAIASELSEYLKLDRSLITEQLRQAPKRQQPSNRMSKVTSDLPPNEVLLLTCLLLSPDAREVVKHYLSTSNIIHLLEIRPILETILALDIDDVPFSLEALSKRLEPRLLRIVTEASFSEAGILEEEAAQQALHCLKALEGKAAEAKFNDLKRRIRQLEQEGNFQAALQLMSELEHAKSAVSG